MSGIYAPNDTRVQATCSFRLKASNSIRASAVLTGRKGWPVPLSANLKRNRNETQ